MKIAVLLFGHLRTYKFCSNFLKKNLLDCYDCDVFIHTWDKLDSQTKSWDNKINQDIELTEEDIKLVKSIYSPKKLLIETQQLGTEDDIIKSIINEKSVSFIGINYMMQSLYKANSLKKQYAQEHNIKYDMIVVTRPDIAIFKQLPDFEYLIREAELLNFDINNIRFFCGLANDSNANVSLIINRGCDMLFWGKEKAIDNFINSNQHIAKDYAHFHFMNVVSIFVSNEIKAGNIPQLVCFEFGKDWQNIKFNNPILKEFNLFETVN